uniref:Aldehyde reductase 2 n=1 Tax=Streltzoviella insularis TaxID=1206366 RepID=A0A7D5YNL7_9NEOP|nr:aldehyde reductase 2 [Streltzoviella insularis]
MNSLKYCLVMAIALLANEVRSSSVVPLVKLNDGREIPTLGIGTWLGFSKEGGLVDPVGDEVEKAVEWAIDAGYRHIDTAHIYSTEDQVGRAVNKKISEGVVKREDVFITTKLWNTRHAKDAVVPTLKESLKQLSLDYVDLYLIHWPIGFYANGSLDNTDYVETWQGMVEAKDQGLAKSIGICNFNQQQIERLISQTSVKPAMLQVEINLNLQQPALLAYCKEQGIAVTAYTPFGSLFPSKATPDAPPPRVDEPALVAIATKYNKTVPQITLRYLVELGAIPIPKSITRSRIEQNIDIFDFELTGDEKQTLRSYDRNYRTIPVKQWIDSPHYPFEKN